MKIPKTVPISQVKTRIEFKSLFAVHDEVVDRISRDMLERGYDKSFPIFLCEVPEVETFLLDGHMRMLSCRKAGIELIPYELKSFASLDEALDYAIHVQRDRRNITDAELYQQILLVDKRRKQGELSSEYKGKSASRTAVLLGTSTRKVEAVRQVRKSATQEQINDITSGKKTINRVLTDVRNRGKGRGSQSLNLEYENLAVQIMMVTAELIPGLENISDEKSAKWEKALVQLIYKNLKNFDQSA